MPELRRARRSITHTGTWQARATHARVRLWGLVVAGISCVVVRVVCVGQHRSADGYDGVAVDVPCALDDADVVALEHGGAVAAMPACAGLGAQRCPPTCDRSRHT